MYCIVNVVYFYFDMYVFGMSICFNRYYVKKMLIIGKLFVLIICCYKMLIVLIYVGNINCIVY